jgi:hypothetical protein
VRSAPGRLVSTLSHPTAMAPSIFDPLAWHRDYLTTKSRIPAGRHSPQAFRG